MALPHIFRTLGILAATGSLLVVYFLTHISMNMLVRRDN